MALRNNAIHGVRVSGDTIQSSSLVGATTQMVVANTAGILSTQTIPSAGQSTIIRNGTNTYTAGTAADYSVNVSGLSIDNIFVTGSTYLNGSTTYVGGRLVLNLSTAPQIRYSGDSTLTGFHFDGGDVISLHTNNLQRLVATSGGTIGINLTTPNVDSNYRLHVSGNTLIQGGLSASTIQSPSLTGSTTQMVIANPNGTLSVTGITAGSGEVNTASNLGSGTGIYASKSGVDLRFKSLSGGTNVTLTNDSNTIVISAASSTGTTNNAWMTSPDYYYFGITGHQNITFAGAGKNQAFIDTNYPSIGAVTTDNVDWAAWQMSVNEATTTGKVLYAYGDYYVHTGITIAKYVNRLTIEGNGCKLYTTNSNAFTILGRIPPTGQTEALNLMSNFKVQIRHIDFIGQGYTQTGYYSGPSYMAQYDGLRFTTLAKGLWLEFALSTTVKNCQALEVYSAFTATYGSWVYSASSPLSGESASNSNSQSNVTIFEKCRAYMGGGDYGFGIYASSGCRVIDCIVEGSQCKNAIDFDAKGSTNVYAFWVQNLHAELSFDSALGLAGTGSLSIGTGTKTITVSTDFCNSDYYVGCPIRLTSIGNGYMDGTVNSYIGTTLECNITSTVGSGTYSDYRVVIRAGSTNSTIKIRSLAGVYSIDGIYSQYASITVDSLATLATNCVKVSNIYSIVPIEGGYYWRTRDYSTAWYFDWTDQLYSDPTDMGNKFATDAGMYAADGVGTTPSLAVDLAAMGYGNNFYKVLPVPR